MQFVCVLQALHAHRFHGTWHQVIFCWTLIAKHLASFFIFKLLPTSTSDYRSTPLLVSFKTPNHQITLLEGQANQISEVLEFFDTDGGWSIDIKKLILVMTDLCFHNQERWLRGPWEGEGERGKGKGGASWHYRVFFCPCRWWERYTCWVQHSDDRGGSWERPIQGGADCIHCSEQAAGLMGTPDMMVLSLSKSWRQDAWRLR